MKKNQQSGNSLIAIILSLAAILVLGLVIWRVFFNNGNQNTSTSSTDPNAGYFVIDEWDLRLMPVDNSQEIVYTINDSGDTIVFSTAELNAISTACSDGQDSEMPLGKLAKLSGEQTAFEPTAEGDGDFIRLINGTYYQYTAPQTSCSEDTEIAATQSTIYNSFFKPSIATLEAEQE